MNENRFAPQFEDFVLIGSLKENQNPGTQVMKVIAKDIDIPGPDSRVSFSTIGGDGLGLFGIDNEGNFYKISQAFRRMKIYLFPHFSISFFFLLLLPFLAHRILPSF